MARAVTQLLLLAVHQGLLRHAEALTSTALSAAIAAWQQAGVLQVHLGLQKQVCACGLALVCVHPSTGSRCAHNDTELMLAQQPTQVVSLAPSLAGRARAVRRAMSPVLMCRVQEALCLPEVLDMTAVAAAEEAVLWLAQESVVAITTLDSMQLLLR